MITGDRVWILTASSHAIGDPVVSVEVGRACRHDDDVLHVTPREGRAMVGNRCSSTDNVNKGLHGQCKQGAVWAM